MIRKRSGRKVAPDSFDGEFLSLLAHELRNPLAPIRFSAAALRLRCTIEADLNAIATIERQVTLLARLVDDLVDGVRLQRGEVSLQKQWVDIGALAQEVVEAMQPIASERGQHLEANLPTTPVQMLCDPVRLKQVLGNLLDNASLRTQAAGTLAVAIETRPNELLVRVSDNGLGIAPEALPHVFNMHASATRTPDTRARRMGVGLAIARSLVELRGGAIRAHSAGLGRGSTFEVRLPLIGTPPQEEISAAVAPAASLRVLVVEDNLDAARSLSELLILHGHVALQTHDGASALQVAGTFHPSVVLLDICLPDLDGHEVARRLREQDGFASVRLIAMTANDSSEHRARAVAAGFDCYLAKPVSIAALNEALAPGSTVARRTG